MKTRLDQSPLVTPRQNSSSPHALGPRPLSQSRFPGAVFAFNPNPCRTVARLKPLFQRFEIPVRRPFSSAFRDAHKRLYSTPAFYSYVWSIVNRVSAGGKSNRIEPQMVFENRPHLRARWDRACGLEGLSRK
jgi:hypothetical protein